MYAQRKERASNERKFEGKCSSTVPTWYPRGFVRVQHRKRCGCRLMCRNSLLASHGASRMSLALLPGLACRRYMRQRRADIHRIRPTWPLARWPIGDSLSKIGLIDMGTTIAATLLVLHTCIPIAWLRGVHA